MSEREQTELFGPSGALAKQFDDCVHTDNGRLVADRFIRVAYGCQVRGIRLGAKAIWERLRWNFMLRKQHAEKWKLNNNHVAYMARFAVQRTASCWLL